MTTVITESGTRYEFNTDMSKVRRGTHWMTCTPADIRVGHPLSFVLQPPGITIRTTTAVASIEEGNE